MRSSPSAHSISTYVTHRLGNGRRKLPNEKHTWIPANLMGISELRANEFLDDISLTQDVLKIIIGWVPGNK